MGTNHEGEDDAGRGADPRPPPPGSGSSGAPGGVGHVVGDDRDYAFLASQGPKVRIPHRPITTLGISGEDLDGEPGAARADPSREPLRQTRRPPPMESGSAITDHDERRYEGAPEDGPGAVLGPHGVGHPVGVHDRAVAAAFGSSCRPSEEVPAADPDAAGQALTASTVRANTSAASGSTTAIHADPRQTPLLGCLRANRPSRFGSKSCCPLTPCAGVAGMLPATPPERMPLLNAQDLLQRLRHDLGGQGLEVDLGQVRRVVAGVLVDRPLQHGANVLRRGAARLVRSTDTRTRSYDDGVYPPLIGP